MYVCMYVCMYVRMYVCTYVRMYVCTYVRMYVRMYIATVRTYVCMYVCIFNMYIYLSCIQLDYLLFLSMGLHYIILKKWLIHENS